MPKRSEEVRRVEATASFQYEMDKKMDEQFPDASADETVQAAYERGDLNFVRFSFESPYQPLLLYIALKRAGDETNKVTYSTHGASGHQVYQDAIQALLASIQDHTYSAVPQKLTSMVKVKGSRTEVPVTRLVVESPRFNREVPQPIPYIKARNLKGNEIAELRRIMAYEGLASAVLTGMYRRFTVEKFFQVLGNPEFVRNVLGRRTPTILRNHPHDAAWLKKLYESLVLPVVRGDQKLPFTVESYTEALDFMEEIGWVTKEERSRSHLFGYQNIPQSPYARAILRGASELAHLYASENYVNPARNEYIDRKYGNSFTSQVITSFLVFE